MAKTFRRVRLKVGPNCYLYNTPRGEWHFVSGKEAPLPLHTVAGDNATELRFALEGVATAAEAVKVVRQYVGTANVTVL